MAFLLPPTTYNAPPRQVRGTYLNTISEDHEETSFGPPGGSGTDSDETVIGRPAGLDASLFVSAPQKSRLANTTLQPSSPTDSSSPCSEDDRKKRSADFDDLYDASDSETHFSNSSPSLRDSVSSDPTSFATDSSRNSVTSPKSNRSSRNRYPSIMIPQSTSWPSLTSPMKGSPMPPTPPPKIPVSPAALSLLPRWVPAINAPPSLDGSSMTSDQVSNISAPVTPDMHTAVEGETWGTQQPVRFREEPDSANDVESDTMSPQEDVLIESSEDWSDILGTFPHIPSTSFHEGLPVGLEIRNVSLSGAETPSDRGVQLPAEAFRTLNQLVAERSPALSSIGSIQEQREKEMQERSAPPSRPRSLDGITPLSDHSGYSFSQLSIPSPGGFFSSLRAGTRHTWCPGLSKSSNPPSSTTAENFYNVPWMESGSIVEQVVEIDDDITEGPITARQVPLDPPLTARRDPTSEESAEGQEADPSSLEAARKVPPAKEIRYEYEEAYEEELLQNAVSHLDRTSVWLAAQSSYMSALRETNPLNDLDNDSLHNHHLSKQEKNDPLDSPMKKAVRFLEDVVSTPEQAEDGVQKEVIFHEAFRHLSHERKRLDAFVHAASRIDAVQSVRVALIDLHIDQLIGKYEIRELLRPKYSGPFSQNPRQTGIFELTPAQIAFRKVEREKAALEQVSMPVWVIDALKYLHGGKLFASPASKRLARAQIPLNDPRCIGSQRFRVLDLGGVTSCDWAWHCAHKWPRVKTYTVVTKSQHTTPNLEGPSNHRQVSVPHLWQLPFRDGHFDVISARSLHALLRHEPVPGQKQIDEYDLCLKECMRVLKPGGYLEFMLMDSSITHSGPLGSAMSVEFGFNLKTRGYDAFPTRVFVHRLRKANFVGIKRAWMFLPMGAPPRMPNILRETPTPNLPSPIEGDVEAVQGPVGSTAAAANVSGLLGGWMWEQWMLKLQLEMGREPEKLLEGTGAVIEEGRNCGAGWRCLSGWARKPRAPRGTIRIRIQQA